MITGLQVYTPYKVCVQACHKNAASTKAPNTLGNAYVQYSLPDFLERTGENSENLICSKPECTDVSTRPVCLYHEFS